MSFNVVRRAKGVVQHLKHLLWLDILEPAAELIIHCRQHNVPNGGAVVEPLLVSVQIVPQAFGAGSSGAGSVTT